MDNYDEALVRTAILLRAQFSLFNVTTHSKTAQPGVRTRGEALHNGEDREGVREGTHYYDEVLPKKRESSGTI